MSVANSAIFSSRDNTHPVLNAQLIGKARSIFASYCALCVDPQQQQQQPPVTGTVLAGVSLVLPAGQGLDVGQPQQQQPAGLNAKGVQRYMADVGCSVSENEAKDIIFGLSQSGVILHKNAEAERQGADGSGEGIRSMMSCRSLNSVTTAGESEAAAGNARNLVLTFPLFLELLMSTQNDCVADVEIQATWNRLDRDADGVLGVSDIRESLAGLSYAAGGNDFCNDDLQVLSQMSAVEIQTLLREYDLDADGLVTFDDLRKAVETS
jgi:Ca2+-binding EF-hand superfamily protein